MHELTPGQPCELCKRRVPYPKKSSSPVTKTTAYRVPLDDAETHEEALEAWAAHWGLLSKPHWKFWLLNYGAAEALAGPKRNLGGQ